MGLSNVMYLGKVRQLCTMVLIVILISEKIWLETMIRANCLPPGPQDIHSNQTAKLQQLFKKYK